MYEYDRLTFWLIILVLVTLVTTLVCSQCIEPGDELRGDVDLNGAINISDAILLTNILHQGYPAPQCLETADVDNNGPVNDDDVQAILDFLFDGCGSCIADPRCVPCQ